MSARDKDLQRYRLEWPSVLAHGIPSKYADGCEDTRELIAAYLERQAETPGVSKRSAYVLNLAATRIRKGEYL